MLLTTHYLEEAEALADRVAIINHGRVVASGPPAELGGRQDGTATVSWLGPNGFEQVATTEPTALVSRLAGQFGGEVPQLAVSRPSLEDVYMQLIGAPGAGKDKAP